MKAITKRVFLLFMSSVILLTPAMLGKAQVLESVEVEVETEPVEYETTTYIPLESIESRSISPRASAVLNETSWGFNKNACSLIYSFMRSTSGSVNITLQKQNSNDTWNDVASKYHSFSFTTLTSTEVSVSNLSAGTYRIKTEIYAVVSGTVYEETQYTGTRRLY